MVYRGKVENGVVVLDAGATIPEGTRVQVEPLAPARMSESAPEQLDSVFQMSELAEGTGATDLAANVDHYLYGHPKVTDGE